MDFAEEELLVAEVVPSLELGVGLLLVVDELYVFNYAAGDEVY